jgi:hypothetical protein
MAEMTERDPGVLVILPDGASYLSSSTTTSGCGRTA